MGRSGRGGNSKSEMQDEEDINRKHEDHCIQMMAMKTSPDYAICFKNPAHLWRDLNNHMVQNWQTSRIVSQLFTRLLIWLNFHNGTLINVGIFLKILYYVGLILNDIYCYYKSALN